MSKVHTSAIIVMPPLDQSDQIQNIRSKYDKAYSRWMPHINLIYPFVPEKEFDSSLAIASKALKSFKPFKLRFGHFQYFEHGRSYTLYLAPTTEPPNALQELQSKLYDSFPFCDDLTIRSPNGFTPHLTCGQFTGKVQVERQKTTFTNSLVPIEFEVSHIHFISRKGEEPFQIKFSLPLGMEEKMEIGHPVTEDSLTNLDDPPHSDPSIQLVTERLDRWITEQAVRGKLPKTREKLRTATKNLAIVPIQVLTPEEVYNSLLVEGYFSVNEEEEIVYLKPESHLDKNRGNQHSTRKWDLMESVPDPEVILQRCRDWIYLDNNSPKTAFALKNSLESLVVVKRRVEIDLIFDILEKKRKIRMVDYDTIQYNV